MQQLKMQQQIITLVSGIIFGFGLGLSQMMDRDRVLGFLDVTGDWDPTLLFVLGGAVTVTVIAFRFVLRRSHPLFADKFSLPTRKDIDLPLLGGATLFGLGWGIGGYCPGPGITALVLGVWNPVIFILAFVVGSITFRLFAKR